MKYIIILLSIFMLMGCDKIIEVDEIPFILNKEGINVYSDIYLNDLLSNLNDVEILSDNYKIYTDDLGTKEYEILYRKDKKKYMYKYSLNVVDKELPIVFSGTNRTVLKGYNNNICDLINYGDNYTGDLKCVIEGDYNLDKVGQYNLIYHISDSSNNVKDVNVTLNVVNSINNGNSYSNLTSPITEVYDLYKEDNNEIGIDVSEWQGNIDFEKVRDAGVKFVIMRIGFQTDTDSIKVDNKYYENMKKAKEAGLKVGVYLYTIVENQEQAKEAALWVIDKLNNEKLELGIAFDWENWKYWNRN